MSDVDAEHVYYDILKADYDEITQWARNAGYTDDEIRMLHQNAAQMRAKLGYNHSAAFHIIMLAASPSITRDFDIKHLGRKRSMFDNLMRRFSIWLGRRTWWARLLGWDHKRTKQKRRNKQWKFEGSDD